MINSFTNGQVLPPTGTSSREASFRQLPYFCTDILNLHRFSPRHHKADSTPCSLLTNLVLLHHHLHGRSTFSFQQIPTTASSVQLRDPQGLARHTSGTSLTGFVLFHVLRQSLPLPTSHERLLPIFQPRQALRNMGDAVHDEQTMIPGVSSSPHLPHFPPHENPSRC